MPSTKSRLACASKSEDLMDAGETPDKSARPPEDRRRTAPKMAIRHLDFYYGDNHVLKDVSLDLFARQVTGLIGPSGCGKSTLLRVLNRMYEMYPAQRVTGEVTLDGDDILGPAVNLQRLRSRVGLVSQAPTTFPMSIHDNIAFGVRLHEHLSRAERDLRVESVLTAVGLWTEVKDRLRQPAGALSGGQQQRLCIARTLATRPEVILLDEPTSALDPISMAKIEDVIDDLKKTITIALVTHNLQQAARCADQVAFFYLGEVVEFGLAADVFTSPKQARTQNYVTGRFG
jgi:phosphate transport system ATP-binding protein